MSNISLTTARASAANEAQFKSLIALGRAQELGFREANQLKKITEQEIGLNNQKIKNLEAVETKTKAQEKQLGILTKRNAELSKIQGAVSDRIETTGRSSLFAARGVRVLGAGFGFAARTALGFIGILSTVVTVVSLFVTFGSIIAEAFGVLDPIKNTLAEILDFFKRIFNLTAEARQASKAGGSLIESIIGEDDNLAILNRQGQEQQIFQAEVLRDSVKDAILAGATASREDFVNFLIGDLGISALQRRLCRAAFWFFP